MTSGMPSARSPAQPSYTPGSRRPGGGAHVERYTPRRRRPGEPRPRRSPKGARRPSASSGYVGLAVELQDEGDAPRDRPPCTSRRDRYRGRWPSSCLLSPDVTGTRVEGGGMGKEVRGTVLQALIEGQDHQRPVAWPMGVEEAPEPRSLARRQGERPKGRTQNEVLTLSFHCVILRTLSFASDFNRGGWVLSTRSPATRGALK